MKKLVWAFFWTMVAAAILLFAQTTVNTRTLRLTASPTVQPCSFSLFGLDVTNKATWFCDAGVWFRAWAAPGPPTAANQVILSSASGAAAWGQVNGGSSCGDGTHAVNFTAGTGFGCQTLTGSAGGIPDYPTITNPPSTGWTWENQGSSTVNFTFGFAHFEIANNAATLRDYYRTAPATPYTVTALMRHQQWNVLSAPGNTGDSAAGIVFRDGTGKLVPFYLFSASGNATTRGFFIEKWNSFSSFNSSYNGWGPNNTLLNVANNGQLFWLRMADDGTNLTWSTSIDGQNWQQVDQRARTLFFASGPTQIGVVFRSDGGTDNGTVANLIDWTAL